MRTFALLLLAVACLTGLATAEEARSVTGAWETATRHGTGSYELKEHPDGTVTGAGTGRPNPESDGSFKWTQTVEIEGRRTADGIQITIRGVMATADGRRLTGQSEERMVQEGPDTLRQQGRANAVWTRKGAGAKAAGGQAGEGPPL